MILSPGAIKHRPQWEPRWRPEPGRGTGTASTARVLAGYRRTASNRRRGQGRRTSPPSSPTSHHPRRRGRGRESEGSPSSAGRLDAVIVPASRDRRFLGPGRSFTGAEHSRRLGVPRRGRWRGRHAGARAWAAASPAPAQTGAKLSTSRSAARSTRGCSGVGARATGGGAGSVGALEDQRRMTSWSYDALFGDR